MSINQGTTPGRALAIETDLARIMADLAGVRDLTRDLRTKRRIAQNEHDTYKRTNLVLAQEQEAVVEAVLVQEILTAKGADGKALYSNEDARKTAVIVAKARHAEYQEAVTILRAAEAHLANLAMNVVEAEDELKSAADYTWNLRSLLDGARSEIMAVVTLDGPKIPAEIRIVAPEGGIPLVVQGLPSEIPLVAQGLPSEIQLKAPTSLPAVYLMSKEAA